MSVMTWRALSISPYLGGGDDVVFQAVVPQCAAHREHAHNPPAGHLATRSLNAIMFQGVLGLVVLGQRLHVTRAAASDVPAQHGSEQGLPLVHISAQLNVSIFRGVHCVVSVTETAAVEVRRGRVRAPAAAVPRVSHVQQPLAARVDVQICRNGSAPARRV